MMIFLALDIRRQTHRKATERSALSLYFAIFVDVLLSRASRYSYMEAGYEAVEELQFRAVHRLS